MIILNSERKETQSFFFILFNEISANIHAHDVEFDMIFGPSLPIGGFVDERTETNSVKFKEIFCPSVALLPEESVGDEITGSFLVALAFN